MKNCLLKTFLLIVLAAIRTTSGKKSKPCFGDLTHARHFLIFFTLFYRKSTLSIASCECALRYTLHEPFKLHKVWLFPRNVHSHLMKITRDGRLDSAISPILMKYAEIESGSAGVAI